MYGSVKKETYELESLQISPDTIRSIKTVEDTVKTEQERERAALEVTPVYQFSEDVANESTGDCNVYLRFSDRSEKRWVSED